jgi:hypothetical protein
VLLFSSFALFSFLLFLYFFFLFGIPSTTGGKPCLLPPFEELRAGLVSIPTSNMILKTITQNDMEGGAGFLVHTVYRS